MRGGDKEGSKPETEGAHEAPDKLTVGKVGHGESRHHLDTLMILSKPHIDSITTGPRPDLRVSCPYSHCYIGHSVSWPDDAFSANRTRENA
jgi:hypothetical protein